MNSRQAAWSLSLGLLFALQAFGVAFAQEAAPAKKKPSRRSPAPLGIPTTTDEADFTQFEEFEKKDSKPVPEPFKYWNKAWFHFNDKFYFWLAKPLAKGYGFIVPEPLRIGISNVYHNLYSPVRMVSSALQGKWKGAGSEFGRLIINSTLGVGGLFEVAEPWAGLQPSEEDLGQVLGFYGVGYGAPLTLPFLGQNNLRDAIGMAPAFLLNPVWYVADTPVYMGVVAGGHFNNLSLHIGEYEKIKKDALDPYTFIRDAHLQNREKKIKE